MKELLVLLAFTAAFAACKKEETAPVDTTPAVEEVPAPPADAPADMPAEGPASNP